MRKLTAAIAAVALAAGPASAAPGPADHVALRSWTLLSDHGPGPTPGERLTARVDAWTVAGHARGHAVVQHVFEQSGTVRAEFDVDCLTVDKTGAITVTGPISQIVATPVGGEPYVLGPGEHPEAGLTFYATDEQHQRRVGWDRTDPQRHSEVFRCGALPASLWVVDGGTVLHR
ncbi:hypothetical protein [Streptomyces sp. NRRL S-350]|uniref:hypothetical protein n=1 Tax=Streptomyces sp. NRRL S-350 TaxID=1463902 RepID=UPI0004C17019|nr:hypothetical protein [Streptomyces sp. NRRL S-350]